MATLLKDTFTDADNTALTAHTPDVGGPWVAVTGTFKILSNTCHPNTAANNDQTVIDAGRSDLTLQCDVTPQASGLFNRNPDLVLRQTDSINFWNVDIVPSAVSANSITLTSRIANVDTNVATASPSVISGTTYTLTVVCLGQIITILLNGVQQISYSLASFNSTATKFGLRLGAAGAGADCTWDNFIASSIESSPPPPLVFGPPFPGAPWLPKTPPPPLAQIPPPAAPSKLVYVPPTSGPPYPGAPWQRLVPVERIQPTTNATPASPPPLGPIYSPPTSGPPMLGAPWTAMLPGYLIQPSTNAPPTIVGAGQGVYVPPTMGPPIPGAPWARILPSPPPSPPTVVPVPTIARGLINKPFLMRVRDTQSEQDKNRLGRITEILSSFWNYQVGLGVIQQTGSATWALRSGGFTANRAPGVNDDNTIGAVPGVIWIDTSTNNVWSCVRNSTGTALWMLLTPGGGGGGFTGTIGG